MASAVIWSITFLSIASAQHLETNKIDVNGICKSVFCNKPERLRQLADCVVILGNLHVHLMDYQNVTFPQLREVTGFVVFYRVNGLESIGQMFPNLSVIRGKQVLYNYALIIYDMPHLKEVGLYSLTRIDKGGVIVWAVPQACYVHTINWEIIAPQARHVLSPPDRVVHCNSVCSCTRNVATNHCWNTWKCQRYLEGPDSEKCNDQCLGCRKTSSTSCSICRNRTFRGKCVQDCPVGTVELLDCGYCIYETECKHLAGWVFNGTCVFKCTPGYQKQEGPNGTHCMPCYKCEETCASLILQTLENIQEASRCVKINGSLTIHIRSLPDTMVEVRTYLAQIEEVADYVVVFSTPTITSLDFLSSLKRIRGQNLRNGSYSLLVYDMTSLQTLFTENVTKTLKIDRGAMFFYNNPVLCMGEIEKLEHLFPMSPRRSFHTSATNGYSGGCMKTSVSLSVNVINETAATVNLTHKIDPQAHYSILYIKLPQGASKAFVPETCSDSEWYAYNVPNNSKNSSIIHLSSLQPAASYALCVEKYDPTKNLIARSGIVNFTTPVGKPEPPFLLELVASSSEVIVLRWVDHKVYKPHITSYELDVSLVDILARDVTARDHCKTDDGRFEEIDLFRHAVVMRPPPNYNRGCESMCGILSSVTAGAMVEEYFDVCSSIESVCNNLEAPRPKNSTFGKFIRTLSLDIKGPRNDFQVGGLAPFRDYRFRLRACSGQCSRSARGVVRTLRSDYADMPIVVYATASENGYIFIKWKPPELTNGPVLSYSIQVLPSLKVDEKAQLVPQIWCESSEKNSIIVKSIKADRYLVRVCSTTLASSNVCSENTKIVTSSGVNWWAGIVFGIILFLTTIVVSCLWRKNRRNSYHELPLLSYMVTSETEPPSMMMTDFVEFYSIPLRDTQID
ncbi:hypothetical protein ACJJTC_006357 [Scirpophaga incertulas]